MKDTTGYSSDGFDYHDSEVPPSSNHRYAYDGEAHVKEWKTYLKQKQAEKESKVKSVLRGLPTDMKQELLAVLLSELKGE